MARSLPVLLLAAHSTVGCRPSDRLAREQIWQIITYMRAPSSVAETSQN